MSSFAAHEGSFASRRFLSSSLRRRMQSGVEGGKVFKVSRVLGSKGSQRSKGLKLPLRFEGVHEFVRLRTHRLSGFKEVAPVMTLTELASILRAKLAKLSHSAVSSRCDTSRLIAYKQKSDAGRSIALWRPFGWDIQKMSPAQGKSGGAQDSGEGGCSTPIRTGTERTKNSSANHYTMEQTFCRNISVLRGQK